MFHSILGSSILFQGQSNINQSCNAFNVTLPLIVTGWAYILLIDVIGGGETWKKIMLDKAMKRLKLSARAYHRILKLARTIADISNSERIETPHLTEAVSYRSLDRSINSQIVDPEKFISSILTENCEQKNNRPHPCFNWNFEQLHNTIFCINKYFYSYNHL